MPERSFPDSLQRRLLALLFLAAAGYQIAYSVSLLAVLSHGQAHVARPFFLNDGSSRVQIVSDAAASSGLRPGDLILSVDGLPYSGEARLTSLLEAQRPGGVLILSVLRDGAPLALRIPLSAPPTIAHPWIQWAFYSVVHILTPALCLGLGFLAVFVRRRDPLAWLLLAMMISFSHLSASSDISAEILWSWINPWRDAAIAYHALAAALWPISMLLFGVYFPDRLPIDRRRPWLKWILIAPVAASALAGALLAVADSESGAAGQLLAAVYHPLGTAAIYIGMAAIAVFFAALGYRQGRAPSPDARRRLRLLNFGSFAAMTPLFIVVIIGVSRGFNHVPEWLWIPAFLLLAVFPLTLVYVIVVHRAMDLRAVLRQGLQYALAQRAVRVLQLAAIAATAFAVFRLANDPLRNRPEKIVALAAAVALAAGVNSGARHLRLWLDRRFFREAYQAEIVLSDLSQRVRTIIETKPLLESVAHSLASTLHIERLAMVVERSGSFHVAFGLGFPEPPDVAFAFSGGAASALQRAREPLQIYFDDPNSWIYRDLNLDPSERDRLLRLDSQVLLPLLARDTLLGFISLGPKRSQEPYSKSDLGLLESVALQTGLALLNSRLTEEIADQVAQRERLNRELEIAREVQQRLFPQVLPPIPGLVYDGRCRPALGVGGDYYDFLALPNGALGLAIGDVSGKGVPAALLMASLQASLRSQAIDGRADLARLMQNLNTLIYNATPANRYATFFYAQFDPYSRLLSYVNGGHNPPLLFRGADVIRLEEGGPVVGLFPPASYTQASIGLLPGDTLVMFTDGVSEAMNSAGDEWGEESLIAAVFDCRSLGPSDIITRLIEGADRFAAGTPQHDDMTLVVVKVGDPNT